VFPNPTEGNRVTEVNLRSGSRMLVHPDEFIGRIVYYFGDLDPRLSWVCRRVIGAGDVVIDVGANYGVISLLAADLVGPTGVVHAFEPQPQVAALLRRSAQRNAFSQLHVHQVGLSDADAELDLHIPVANLGSASLDRVAGPGSSIKVSVRHSGTLLSELGLPAIRLLKLDVEGHEAAVLRGARGFLRRCPPDVILFESNDTLYEAGKPVPFWERDAVRELCDLGYDLVRVTQHIGALGPPRFARVRSGGDDRGLDFVAVHRSKYREIADILAVA